MTLKELLEILREEHPDIGMNHMIKLLNRASDDFSTRTKVLQASFTASLVKDQRYYDLSDDIMEVTRIDINDEEAPQLIGMPNIRDNT